MLKIAVKSSSGLVTGDPKYSHAALAKKNGLPEPEESLRGFSPDGKIFLDRKQALEWIKKYEPDIYEKAKSLAPAEGIHSDNYAEAKGIKQRVEQSKVDLSNKTCIVFDRGGLYTYVAQRLGKEFGKVGYYIPDAEAYPESQKAQIGKGLSGIERLNDEQYYQWIKKSDLIVFPDCYDGAYQNYLVNEGHCVFGSGLSEKMEIDKIFFLETLEKLGLPVAFTKLVKGIPELTDYLTGKKDKWIKGLYRGDFETKKYTGARQFKNWLENYLIPKLGTKAKDIEILIQNKIESVAECGYDGFRVDGECTSNCLVGYEIKDKGLVAKVFEQPPEIIKSVNDSLTPIYKKLGYRGHYSNEIRVTEKGKAYAIDETCRTPSPPGELMSLIYENYPEVIWKVAHGEMPIPKAKAQYGAEIILTSDFYEKHQICVEFPESVSDNVMLKNHTKRDGAYYCIPNGNGSFFGAVAATGSTVKEATTKCLEIAEQIVCDDMEYSKKVFDDASDPVKAGERFGIKY